MTLITEAVEPTGDTTCSILLTLCLFIKLR